MFLYRKGVVEWYSIPCEAIRERDEALHSEEVYVCLRYGGRICLVELVNTNDGPKDKPYVLQVEAGDPPLHFHRGSLHAQASLGTHHPDDVRYGRTCGRRHHPGDAIQAMTM